ncbi:hypothetical protein HK405_004472, partial [Cladochytrium tenue]
VVYSASRAHTAQAGCARRPVRMRSVRPVVPTAVGPEPAPADGARARTDERRLRLRRAAAANTVSRVRVSVPQSGGVQQAPPRVPAGAAAVDGAAAGRACVRAAGSAERPV